MIKVGDDRLFMKSHVSENNRALTIQHISLRLTGQVLAKIKTLKTITRTALAPVNVERRLHKLANDEERVRQVD